MGHGGGFTRRKPNTNTKKNPSLKSKLGGTFAGGLHKINNATNKKKSKASSSLKNQIRSTQRLLQRDLPAEVKAAQEKKLEELKKQQLEQIRLVEERRISLRNKKIRFFERRKIERRMRRLEKQQRDSLEEAEEKKIMEQLGGLKEDLEYVRFFPKAEKYVPLFCGDDNAELVDDRNRLRMQIKANIIAAAASGKDLTETGSEDDGPTDATDDDFFVSGSSSDEADADDELTDISAREHASGVPAKTALGMSKDMPNQKPARSLMPPPRPKKSWTDTYDHSTSRNTLKNHKISNSTDRGFRNAQAGPSTNRVSNTDPPKYSNDRRFQHAQAGQSSNRSSNSDISRYSKNRGFRHAQAGQSSNRSSNSDTSKHSNDGVFRVGQAVQSSSRSSAITDTPSHNRGFPNSQVASQSSNISSNSDAPKRKRKRRPKKKKE